MVRKKLLIYDLINLFFSNNLYNHIDHLKNIEVMNTVYEMIGISLKP